MTLVIGATGILGSEICRLLTAEGKTVKAMVRETSDQSKVNNLKKLGVDIVYGDLRKISSFSLALQGVTEVISTASAMPFSYKPEENDIENVDMNGMIQFIDTCKSTGVKHFIYTSFSGNIDLDFPLKNAKRTVEDHLKKTGINYTILRPSCFMEAWLSEAVGFDFHHFKAQLSGLGDQPVSYISCFDVARFALESLTNPAANNATLELGGPEKLSQLDVVKIFEEVTGHKFEIQSTPVKTLKDNLRSSENNMEKSFAGLMLCLAKGDPIEMEYTLESFPIKLTTVREYAEKVEAGLLAGMS